MTEFLSPAASCGAQTSHSSSLPQRFIQRLELEEEKARRIATFYRFRRAGREAFQRTHWAHQSNAEPYHEDHNSRTSTSSNSHSLHYSISAASSSAPSSKSASVSPPRPTRFNWRILRHPRNAFGDPCKVGQLSQGVFYSVAGKEDQHFRYVPRELEAAHYCMSPTSREAVEPSRSLRDAGYGYSWIEGL